MAADLGHRPDLADRLCRECEEHQWVGLAGTATAVVLFRVLKRWSESAALGVVTARVVALPG